VYPLLGFFAQEKGFAPETLPGLAPCSRLSILNINYLLVHLAKLIEIDVWGERFTFRAKLLATKRENKHMKPGKALVGIFVMLLQGCASNLGEPSSTLTEHPQFRNEKLAKWQSEILDRHATFASYIENRDSLPEGCRPPQSELWDIASQSPFTEEEFEKENRVIEKRAVITSGRCVEGESLAVPYIAESIFRYTSTKQNRMRPETVKGKQIVTSYEGQIRRLSLSKERTRYQHSVSQKGIRLAIALPLEEDSRGLAGIDAVDTVVSRRTDPRTIHTLRYTGSNLAYEWWTRDGELHGMFVMHPHQMLNGPWGESPGSRTCYQYGEKASLSECGATASTGSSDSGAAAILGGLAAVALGNEVGLSENSAIDMGVRVARDIEQGELSADTYNAARNVSVGPSKGSTINQQDSARQQIQSQHDAEQRAQQQDATASSRNADVSFSISGSSGSGSASGFKSGASTSRSGQGGSPRSNSRDNATGKFDQIGAVNHPASDPRRNGVDSKSARNDGAPTSRSSDNASSTSASVVDAGGGRIWEPVPEVVTGENGSSFSDRDYAIAMARLGAVNDIVDICLDKGARTNSPRFNDIQAGNVPIRWNMSNPDCRQTGSGEWKCEAKVSGTCYREDWMR
tara:strand:+ start:3041 stop:4927 length:1887 start_codon:yes stop_codon:yes gene_type:complete